MQIRRKSLILLAIVLMCLSVGAHSQSLNKPIYSAEPMVVLITEVQFDPEPVIGLPSKEYIELYNNSNDTINLDNWILRVGDKKVDLPPKLLAPNKFVLLTSKSGLEDFLYLNIDLLAPETWPALRNSGQYIALLSPEGNIIHFMTYHPDQFEDLLKKEGGWSLELADFSTPCVQGSWVPSEHYSGGTPGKENSMEIISKDSGSPKALRVGILDYNRIFMLLDRPVLPLYTEDWFRFEFEDGECEVASWDYYKDQASVIEIVLKEIIPDETILSMQVSGDACDCSGMQFYPDIIKFGIPGEPKSGDVVISEILFDPLDSQTEFVGIHNRSDKLIALNDLYLALCDEEGNITRFSKPNQDSFLMLPDKEYVLTSSALPVLKMSDQVPQGQVCERSDIPALPNTGTALCLLDNDQVLLDMVRYDPDWYSSTIGDTKGISLERISLENGGIDASNWHLASIVMGGASPGMPNSQRMILHDDSDLFSMENQVFSPNQDGFRDYLLINFCINEIGWQGKAGVWDLSGRKLKELTATAVLPVKGSLKWDGCNEFGKLASPGYYAIIINYIRPDGSKGRWKEACVLQ